jgi:hypothetical protein
VINTPRIFENVGITQITCYTVQHLRMTWILNTNAVKTSKVRYQILPPTPLPPKKNSQGVRLTIHFHLLSILTPCYCVLSLRQSQYRGHSSTIFVFRKVPFVFLSNPHFSTVERSKSILKNNKFFPILSCRASKPHRFRRLSTNQGHFSGFSHFFRWQIMVNRSGIKVM